MVGLLLSSSKKVFTNLYSSRLEFLFPSKDCFMPSHSVVALKKAVDKMGASFIS